MFFYYLGFIAVNPLVRSLPVKKECWAVKVGVFVAAVMVVLSMGSASAMACQVNLEGTLNRAHYKLRIPHDWNRTLILYAHGYSYLERDAGQGDLSYADAAPGGSVMEDYLLANGYAVAGSTFSSDGWAVDEGMSDTRALRNYFVSRFHPDRIILVGYSMGSIIALKSAETRPSEYDGVIAGCSIGSGTTQIFDAMGDLALAYDVALGWPDTWGSPQTVDPSLNFWTDVLPGLGASLSDPNNMGKFEFIRVLFDMPMEGFYAAPQSFMIFDMFFDTQARSEMQARAGGPTVDNSTHYYSMSEEKKEYLRYFGVDSNVLLAKMNARTDMARSKKVGRYLRQNADFNGRLKMPVITLRNTVDGITPSWHDTAYLETVETAGRTDRLLQVFANGLNHCRFSPEQLLKTIKAMESWLDTHRKPGMYMFPEQDGFVHDFKPSPWPVGTK